MVEEGINLLPLKDAVKAREAAASALGRLGFSVRRHGLDVIAVKRGCVVYAGLRAGWHVMELVIHGCSPEVAGEVSRAVSSAVSGLRVEVTQE
ncbi:MAG: hypothetical protein DRN99_01640 [Thermoproteota archaeon]|nr:MAG: hypothetical protein DRN99_01640 [Candidatus Korarchaeota archaeon]